MHAIWKNTDWLVREKYQCMHILEKLIALHSFHLTSGSDMDLDINQQATECITSMCVCVWEGGGEYYAATRGATQLLLEGCNSINLDTEVRQRVPLPYGLWTKRFPELFRTHT